MTEVLPQLKGSILDTGVLEEFRLKTYFIQKGEYGPVKIGRAAYPSKRLRELQVANPEKLQLLCTIDGDHEAELHCLFDSYRLEGEWFRYDGAVAAWICQRFHVHRRVDPQPQ